MKPASAAGLVSSNRTSSGPVLTPYRKEAGRAEAGRKTRLLSQASALLKIPTISYCSASPETIFLDMSNSSQR